jgi:glycosyltransferase involved in cell wall biosynthesis
MRPLSVLAVTNMYPTDARPAYGTFIHSQIQSLREAGIDVDVVFIDGKATPLNYARGLRTIRNAINGKPYDLIHAHYGLTGLVARTQYRLPLVVSFCGDDLLGTPARSRRRRTARSMAIVAACQALAPTCEAIIVKSDEMRRRLWSPRVRETAYVIPNGVDLALLQPLDQARARAELSLAPKRYVLFPHTVDEPRKRFELATAAVELLRKEYPDAEMLVVNGQAATHMPLYYSVADALILTSDWEGSPNVVKEALACELPIVSVDVGDVAERIADAPSCAICDRTPESLAAALSNALAHPRPGGLRKRVEELATPVIARRVVEVYEAVLRQRRQNAENSSAS